MNEMTNSHILAHTFTYLEAASVQQAVGWLAQHAGQTKLLAGGTDLIVQMKMERFKPAYVIGIHRIPGLDRIESYGQGLTIGALTTVRALRNDPVVRRVYPALAESCDAFSTTQIQMMGTLGGNLCNGSPAADTAPALLAYGAEAVIAGPDGERTLPLDEFFLGPGRTALGQAEMLTHLRLPAPFTGTGSVFFKIARVAADLAKVSAAFALERDGDRIVACRLAYGAVAPTPRRSLQAEALLIGKTLTPELAAEAGALAAQEMTPIDDARSNAWYRRRLVDVMTRDGLVEAWERAGRQVSFNNAGAVPAEAPSIGIEARPVTASNGNGSGGDIREISLTVNGVLRRVRVKPNDLLLNVLREDLELTGTKYGCGIGECSACTIHLDGKPALACLVLAVSADGSRVTTIEGLEGPRGELDPLQEAFLDFAAYQCGYCTPGMLMTAKSLLTEMPHPTEDDVRDYLKGNLCRCTGYTSIVRAVLGAAEEQTART